MQLTCIVHDSWMLFGTNHIWQDHHQPSTCLSMIV